MKNVKLTKFKATANVSSFCSVGMVNVLVYFLFQCSYLNYEGRSIRKILRCALWDD